MAVITIEQLNEILTRCGYSPVGYDVSSEVVGQTNASIVDCNEAAMFVAHLIHESGGFQHREEIGRGRGQPYGTTFYGRGYIQLTWEGNYQAASYDIFGDSRLVTNPDCVSASPRLSMRVSVWYWEERVRPQAGSFRNFYATTKAINGGLETSPCHPAAKKRYSFYRKAADVLGVANLAFEG